MMRFNTGHDPLWQFLNNSFATINLKIMKLKPSTPRTLGYSTKISNCHKQIEKIKLKLRQDIGY